MAEVSTTSDYGRTRRLPAWMLKSCSNNEKAKSEHGNKTTLEPKMQPEVQNEIKPSKRKTERRSKALDAEDTSEQVALQKCQARERTRRTSRKNVVYDDELDEHEKENDVGATKVNARAVQKKNNTRKRKLGDVGMETSLPEATDDEIDLTIDDLVRIAEEYVNAEKENQCNPSTSRENHDQKLPAFPPVSSTTTLEGSMVDAVSLKGLSRCTMMRTTSHLNDSGQDEQETPEEEACSTSFVKTGDAAQDMLNLFLGPLLGKPPDQEYEAIDTISLTSSYEPKKKLEAVETVSMSSSFEPSEKDVSTEMLKECQQVKKKKSSLKDMVALFLD